MKADLILARGQVRTLGRDGLSVHSHLAIAGGLVVAAGGADVMGLRGSRTRVIDLRGAAVFRYLNLFWSADEAADDCAATNKRRNDKASQLARCSNGQNGHEFKLRFWFIWWGMSIGPGW